MQPRGFQSSGEAANTLNVLTRLRAITQLSEACAIISGHGKEDGGSIVLASSLPCDD